MIFLGTQRGGGRNLAAHLMNTRDNEHVELHQLRGFSAETLNGAFNEAYAMSKGTQCKKYLFSLSVNPPPRAQTTTGDFETAIDSAEERLGLAGQPRAIVFHEKEGRRHAHVVWSRIDSDTMTAKQLSFTHLKLQDLSRDLFIEHGWRMPEGMVDRSLRDHATFTLDEAQQAKRNGHDPRTIKTALQDAWARSDCQKSFTHALKDRGYILARGDCRGFVAIDRQGDVYSVPKFIGIKTKEVRARIRDAETLPSVDEAQALNQREMQAANEKLRTEIDQKIERRRAALERRKQGLIARHRAEREKLFNDLKARELREGQERQARFRKGLSGLWDRVRGEHRRIQERNEREALAGMQRDRAQKDRLILKQLDQRQRFKDFEQQEMKPFRDRDSEFDRERTRLKDLQKVAAKEEDTQKKTKVRKQSLSPPHLRGRFEL